MNNEQIAFSDREQFWQTVTTNPEEKWDVIVVGGGIIGAGILRESIRRGFKTLLIEQRDFAWGTSSRSSKMVHGGLRYIAQGDIKLTKHSLQERERLLKEVPGLINRLGYYFLLRKGQFPGKFVMSILLNFYDWLAGIKDNRFFTKSAIKAHFNGIDDNRLTGACYYTDSVVDDARLVLRLLQESIQAGGHVVNYVKAKSLIYKNLPDKEAQVSGIIIEDTSDENQQAKQLMQKMQDKQTHQLNSSVVINATGAWADKLRSEVIDEKRIRPLRGSHLLFYQDRLPIKEALTLFHPEDKRPVFILAWEGVTLVGTTDLDHLENINDEASITQQELDYLLEVIDINFPKVNINALDVISSFSGVRPVITDDNAFHKHNKKVSIKKKSPSKERRDHAVWTNKGLITATGGKLTTFRLTAIDALNAALPWLETNLKAVKYSDSSEPMFDTAKVDELFPEAFISDNENDNKSDADNKKPGKITYQNWLQRLTGRYGKHAKKLLTQASDDEKKLIDITQFSLAECRWAIKYEAVVHLDDLLLRRTRLGLLVKNGAAQLLPKLAIIFQQELGWDSEKWQAEVNRYQKIWQKHYSVPLPSSSLK